MKSIKIVIISLVIFVSCSTNVNESTKTTEREVYPGITHRQIINSEDTLFVNILKIDLDRNDYYINAVKADDSLLGRETVSSMSERLTNEGEEVIAAVNSDFFIITEGGESENNLVISSKFVKGTPETDSQYDTFDNTHYQFALTEKNKPLIERFNFDGTLLLQNNEFKINRINSRTDSSSITLYNSYQGSLTPPENNNQKILELKLKPIGEKGDTLIFIRIGKEVNHGRNSIRKENYFLSASDELADSLENYLVNIDTIEAVLKLSPDYGEIFTSTGGWGKIVDEGKNIAGLVDSNEGTFPKFSQVKHPRTGIGISKDSAFVYFITVDGRQESSSGVSLPEFADLMLEEGIYQGLNFDGGGSTTMVIDGKVVNNPSDKTGERPVGVGLAIIKK